MALEVATAIVASMLASSMYELLIKLKKPSQKVAIELADGNDLEFTRNEILHFSGHGKSPSVGELKTASGESLTAVQIAAALAAVNLALPSASEQEHTDGDVTSLVAPDSDPGLVRAYLRILQREYAWESTENLEIAASLFAMEDGARRQLGTAVEIDDLDADVDLLEQFVEPPELTGIATT